MTPTTLKVIETVCKTAQVPAHEINENSILTFDLEFDSLDIIECIMSLESTFNISIRNEEFETIAHKMTISDLVNIVEPKLK